LLDVDAGVSTNRTVYTFVGAPVAVVRGAFNAARTARRLINMVAHRGEGAVFFNSILALLIVSD
jgi:glutamate formiminotransferase/formiminotetrahydrofolate cyclodeaminase